nr:hypothetical protein [Tanacetum cinerariifolium]
TPEKVLVREKASSPITKCVNAISLIKIKKENGIKGNEVVNKSVIEHSKLDAVEPLESGDRKEEVKDEMDDESARSTKEELTGWEIKVEVVVETPRSRNIGYYLKHEINKKLIEGLVKNQKYNDSLLATRLGIAEDVLVEIAGYVYPVDFVILDIKKDKKKPFILGTPFLTMDKAEIMFDKGTITKR